MNRCERRDVIREEEDDDYFSNDSEGEDVYRKENKRQVPDLVIRQNIDFYIMKSEMNDPKMERRRKQGNKVRNKKDGEYEGEKKDRGKVMGKHSDRSFEKLRQENQHLKDRLNLALNELEFFKKRQNENPERSETPKRSKSREPPASQDKKKKEKGVFDISDLKRNLVERFVQKKQMENSIAFNKKFTFKKQVNKTIDKVIEVSANNESKVSQKESSKLLKKDNISELLKKISKIKSSGLSSSQASPLLSKMKFPNAVQFQGMEVHKVQEDPKNQMKATRLRILGQVIPQ